MPHSYPKRPQQTQRSLNTVRTIYSTFPRGMSRNFEGKPPLIEGTNTWHTSLRLVQHRHNKPLLSLCVLHLTLLPTFLRISIYTSIRTNTSGWGATWRGTVMVASWCHSRPALVFAAAAEIWATRSSWVAKRIMRPCPGSIHLLERRRGNGVGAYIIGMKNVSGTRLPFWGEKTVHSTHPGEPLQLVTSRQENSPSSNGVIR